MNDGIDVIALARQAGLCFPDCNFLDLNPYDDLLTTLAGYETEAERDNYLQLVKNDERHRQEKLHQLELFAALVIRAARDQVEDAAQSWQDDDFSVWVGAAKAAARLEVAAMVLEHAHQPELQEAA